MNEDETAPLLLSGKSFENISTRKKISLFGGVSLLVNSMTGPALVNIPAIISRSGWLSVAIVVLLMWGISSFSSFVLLETMSLYPNNNKFQGEVELTGLCKHHFGKKIFYFILLVLNVCLLSLNIASIIATAQSIDYVLFNIFGAACGLEFSPHFRFMCVHSAATASSTPFGDMYVLSVGILIVLAVVVPLGYINLSNNIIVQKGAFMSVIAIAIWWTIDFARIGFKGNVPVWGGMPNQESVLGTVMFNFVVAVAIPSWCNEKKLNVNPRAVVSLSTTAASLIFFYIGILGSLAFPFPGNSNLLSVIDTCTDCYIITKITCYFLPIAVFLTSIPVYSIIVRYNLIENKIVPKGVDFFISVIVPWLIAVPFYTGSGLINVINWASLFLQSSINFILPMVLYIKVKRELSRKEHEIQDNFDHFQAISNSSVGIKLAMFIVVFIILAVAGVVVLNVL